jgi:hypothetical protein
MNLLDTIGIIMIGISSISMIAYLFLSWCNSIYCTYSIDMYKVEKSLLDRIIAIATVVTVITFFYLMFLGLYNNFPI